VARTAQRDAVRLVRLERLGRAAGLTGLAGVALRGIVAVHDQGGALPTAALVGVVGLSASLLYVASRARRARESLLARTAAVHVAEEILRHLPRNAERRARHPYRAACANDATGVSAPSWSRARVVLASVRAWVGARRPSLHRASAVVVALVAISVLAASYAGPASAAKQRWTFLTGDTPSALGLAVHAESGGAWSVEDHAHATGARALVNREGESGSAPAVMVASGTQAPDARVLTRCKAASVKGERACGVVFRFADPDHYDVVRIDADAGAVILSVVRGGTERRVASYVANVAPDVWHELQVEARADHVRVVWNGVAALDVREHAGSAGDRVGAGAGSVGLWVPASGEAWFDELSIEPLPSARGLDVLPLLGRRSS